MTTVRTACNRDCPAACSILAHVEDGRVVRLRATRTARHRLSLLPHRPVPRAAVQPRAPHHPAHSPRRRHRPATWDEALDLCAETLRQVRDESSPEAIFHYRSGGSLGLVKHVAAASSPSSAPSPTSAATSAGARATPRR
ncbi:MAG: hypothetical protein U0325_04660 [Polyangiales bacterium]